MNSTTPSVIIIGAGIGGLSAGIYAQLNGYRSRIYEMHSQSGGLMTAWKRKGYTIDGCIHWLSFSNPKDSNYHLWEEIGLIQGREIFNPEIFSRIERGRQVLNIYSNANKLEAELLRIAPEDRAAIHELCSAVRIFSKLDPPGEIRRWKDLLKMLASIPALLRALPLFPRWTKLDNAGMAAKFQNPFLREVFTKIWYPNMSAMGLLFTLAMLHNHGAGYPMGGSLPMAHAVEKRYWDLGGEINYNCRVEKILVEGGKAVGVVLADGQEQRADVIISAADGYATIYKMLEGRYVSDSLRELFQKQEIFPPILFIGLGVNRQFPELQGITAGVSHYLDEPLTIAGEKAERLDFVIHNFDPSLAPAGKTVLTIMQTTSYAFWKELHGEPERYEAEKERVALEIINRLDRRFPGLAGQVEMADVATPVTFERYTGNWQGSFEGWLPTPKAVMSKIEKTLPGLENFYMVGQWVQAGGGLPSGVMTGRQVLQMLCKKDGKKFKA